MNEEMKDCHVSPMRNKKLWLIDFEIRKKGKGCAVIQASNSNEAIQLLKSEGVFNGTPSDYLINRVEEIIPAINSVLLSEQVLINNIE